ncbi:dehydrogenase [Aureococcus anophagefferens]|nr:dehydrogenase [Aureococcus anophagefferens]
MLSRARRVADAPRAAASLRHAAAASLRRASRRFGAAPRLAVAERSARYAELSSDDVAAFRTMTSSVLEGAEACRPYNVDWMSKWEGRARVVLRPASTAEVSAILKYCDARRLAVVPQGGKTGLVGGSVPVHDEVVLSLARMDRIEAFDADTGVATMEAGVVLGDLDAFLRERGFVAPLDLGASGTCTVGGNLATNAGGVRFVRYGSLRGSCVGVEFVKADGTVVDCASVPLRKDNTGYALPQLLIGSEGTLGVITRRRWRRRAEAVSVLSAIEFVDGNALRAVLDRERDLDDPPPAAPRASALVECAGSDGAHDGAKLERFLEAAFDDGCVSDGVLAPSATKAERLWRLREGVSDSMTAAGFVYKYDVSLPHAHLYRLVDECRDRLAAAGFPDGEEINVAGYGHVGDANLHLNVCDFFGYREPLRAALEPWVFERVAALGGSVSAEHGVGQCKTDYLHLNKPPPALALMAELKRAMDPNLILNPYKVLPPALLDEP